MTALMVALGAAAGAPARYLIDRAIRARHETPFPWATLTANLLACLLLGIITGIGSHWDPLIAALLGTGFCGTLSTYSTFSYESMRLNRSGFGFYAATNVVISLLAGIGAAALGWSIGLALIA